MINYDVLNNFNTSSCNNKMEELVIDKKEDISRVVHKKGPMKCKIHSAIEGWIIFVSNIHPEAQEDDIHDLFSDYGKIRNIHLNIDRRTGTNKGYALVEYGELESAENAILNLNSKEFLGKNLKLDFAFKNSE